MKEALNRAQIAFKKDEVLFISSNGWDIAGAASFGFKTLWINRLNLPADRLPFKPHSISADLTSIEDFFG